MRLTKIETGGKRLIESMQMTFDVGTTTYQTQKWGTLEFDKEYIFKDKSPIKKMRVYAADILYGFKIYERNNKSILFGVEKNPYFELNNVQIFGAAADQRKDRYGMTYISGLRLQPFNTY